MERSSTNSPIGLYASVAIAWIIIFLSPGLVFGSQELFPEPNPPKIEFDEEIPSYPQTVPLALAPSTEWTYHKTGDNTHPDANEQQMMWLMNRARANPAAEGAWLAAVDDPDIIIARIFFSVDPNVLQDEFAGYDYKPPAAFDVRLYSAAKAHSDYLISIDAQNHDDQFARITDEGFTYTQARGNVFSYSKSAVYGHAAFNIDWGPGDTTGMQPGRGHRMAIMSIDGDYTNAGIAAVSETDSSTDVGPLVVTGNFCRANTFVAAHYNRFLVGTVWNDDNGNSFFDPGEGIGGVLVMPDVGTFYAVTSASGGYSLPLTEPGSYEVTFSGAQLDGEIVKTITVGDESVLLDLNETLVSSNTGTNPPQPADSGSGGGGGCFIASMVSVTRVSYLTPELWPVITLFGVFFIGLSAVGRKKGGVNFKVFSIEVLGSRVGHR